jgi:hypothetical protein
MVNPINIYRALKVLATPGKAKGTVKVFRGDTTNKTKNFNMKEFYKKNPVHKFFDKSSMKGRFGEITKKRDTAKGRWFSTDKHVAQSYKDKKTGVLLEAEISKKDLILGSKMKKRYFKGVETNDDTILLPRKNLKDVKESFRSGGFASHSNYIKELLK